MIYELVKHVFEFLKEGFYLICCIRVVAISGLSLWSTSSYLCIAYGGIGVVCGLVRYVVGSSEVDVSFYCLCFLSLLGRGRWCSLYNWPDGSRCIKHIWHVYLEFSYMLLCRVVHRI